ncbi:MAG: 4-hydroxybutyrate CoA-transferase, partial [Deltaproteobacteria bacterium]|nr:4-hydroxybutyrate CoA-transferase [Deltaproteobacteria bacterium]
NRPVSGIGGASDFIRGANSQPNGRPIVALPSITAKGDSRLVAFLRTGTPVTIARSDGVIVATENGIADLRNISTKKRAEALIAIANPLHQDTLARTFFDRTYRLPQ